MVELARPMKGYLIVIGVFAAVAVVGWYGERAYQYSQAERALLDEEYVIAHERLWPLAQRDHVGAQEYMAMLYSFGDGVRQSTERAIYWHKRAADNGSPSSQLAVGSRYLLGQGVVQDTKTGAHYIALSAKQGIAEAEMTLGSLYYSGEGLPKDDKQAIKWMSKAVEQGISPPEWYIELTAP